MIVLNERRKQRHPLDNVRIGLELEFAYASEEKGNEDILEIYTLEEYYSYKKDEIFEYKIKPILEEYFSGWIIEFVEKNTPKEFTDQNILYVSPDTSIDKIEILDTKPITYPYEDDDDENGNKPETYISRYKVILGYEIITPPFEKENGELLEEHLKNFLENFRNMIDFNYPLLQTTDACGLHVNISLTDKEFNSLISSIISLLFDQAYQISDDDIREKYAKNSLKNLMKTFNFSINTTRLEKIVELFRKQPTKENLKNLWYNLSIILKDLKYISIVPHEDEYMEFRVLGGENYEDNITEILEKIKKFASYIKKAFVVQEKKARQLLSRLFKFYLTFKQKKLTHDIIMKLPSHWSLKFKDLTLDELKKEIIWEMKKILKKKPYSKVELKDFLQMLKILVTQDPMKDFNFYKNLIDFIKTKIEKS